MRIPSFVLSGLFLPSAFLIPTSRGEDCVQFVQQRRERFSKQLVGLAEAAALVERREFQIFRVNAQAGGDVVADQVEPGELSGVKTSRRPWPCP